MRFRTGIPKNEECFDMPEDDKMYSVHGNVTEELTQDLPEPKGKEVRTSTFRDASFMHCKVTGKSVTGLLLLVNQTPIDWFYKKQGTVGTATYGEEFVSHRTGTEQILDIRFTLRYTILVIWG